MDRKSVPIIALVLSALLAALAFAAPAAAFIYWADSGHQSIGRADNDGSKVEPSFIRSGSGPSAVAVDAGHVYWTNEGGNSIGRANIDGTGVDNGFIAGVAQPTGVAVNGSSIYWSAFNGYIGRANLDGSNPQKTFIAEPAGPTGIGLDSGHIYWSALATGTPAYIGRASLDGFIKDPTYVTIAAGVPRGVAVNSANIYWADFGFLGPGTRIGRAKTSDGKGVDESFIAGASAPCGPVLYGLQLYWTNGEANTIARANSDGTTVDQSFLATGGKGICGVAVDGLSSPPAPPAGGGSGGGGGGGGGGGPLPDTTPPTTRITAGPGKKLARGKARFSFRSDEAGSRFVCKLDKSKPRPCASPRTYKALKPGRHTFKVWAIDAAGNKALRPAKRLFKVPA